MLAEEFGHEESEPDVNNTIRDALDHFADAGADVEEVSIPMHLDGLSIGNGIVMEETTATVNAEGIGHFGDGYYDTQLMDAFGRARRAQTDDYILTL